MKTAHVVLGMHRSGTSSVAGVLALTGARPPKTLMGPAEDNPKGFWESYAVSDLNDRILSAGDSSWSDWRRFPIEVAEPFLSTGLEVLDSEFGGADRLVLKDPRICRLYPFWRRLLREAGYTPVVVSPVRHPAEVRASLAGRNGMASDDAFKLWLRHVLEAEHASRGDIRRTILWSDFLADWRKELAAVDQTTTACLDLGRPAIQQEIDAFLTPDLRHHRDAGADTPLLCREVFEALSDLSRGESGALVYRLDDLRRRFDVLT